MKHPDILLAIRPVIKAFNQLSIPYYIGGSIASSLYGIARATMDVDVVADIALSNVSSLYGLLEKQYYIEEQMIRDAIQKGGSFNIIHLDTMIKIDVFTRTKDPYSQSAFTRRLKDRLVEHEQDSDFYFSSPEDIILSKLNWYEMGNRVSERQWLDVLGVIKVQGESLNMEYLTNWAKELRLYGLLQQAFADAGMDHPGKKPLP